jgi:3,4-dihydroxy 2-butanone 4-phosphate synthase / GTP cyclohydrolase II
VTATSPQLSEAVEALARGEAVLVSDDDARENETDLIAAAEAVTTDTMAFVLRHTSGLVCVGLSPGRCDALDLPLMVDQNTESHGTAFTVSVDYAADAVTTGISAHDRALTVRKLADASCRPGDFNRPGHIFPLRARPGGVLKRAGHTEAAVDLARLASLGEAGLLCEVVSADRTQMATRAEVRQLSAEHAIPWISVSDIVRHRARTERLVRATESARIPTRHGPFACHAWTSTIDGVEHLAFVRGEVRGDAPVLVRVHSECLTGDVFGSERCDCGTQLEGALERIAAEGWGVVVYLRGHEGRGIGLSHKLAAYNLQDHGHDTVDANLALGLPVDDREYGIGAQILWELGVRRLRLMTNNPAKLSGLSGYGLEIVEHVPLKPHVTPENLRYLATKRDRMGHALSADLTVATG